MRIISADSGAALLNERYEAQYIVAAVSVLVEPPYRIAQKHITEPIFSKVANSHELIVHELELCQMLLKETKADVVHLDMSFGGALMEELSPIQLSNISSKARGYLLKILPKMRKIAADIKRVYGIEVLAIGKDSVPVRIAELTAGAYAILYAAEKVVKEKQGVLLGMPSKCYARRIENGVVVHSLIPAEHDIVGFAADTDEILAKVTSSELLNPCARGFRALEITPKVEPV
ncbi:MAG TPA: DUF4152 family protein [Candidatus Krumholzibacteriaceae bacterium]|nr:DUF4152 family protein [Candidatus Krumholzibacteriaceae bacterium]